MSNLTVKMLQSLSTSGHRSRPETQIMLDVTNEFERGFSQMTSKFRSQISSIFIPDIAKSYNGLESLPQAGVISEKESVHRYKMEDSLNLVIADFKRILFTVKSSKGVPKIRGWPKREVCSISHLLQLFVYFC